MGHNTSEHVRQEGGIGLSDKKICPIMSAGGTVTACREDCKAMDGYGGCQVINGLGAIASWWENHS